MNANYNQVISKKRPPFYAWECITLQLDNREVDLVVQNDKDMDDLLEVLIDALDTVDGNKGSANVIYKIIQQEKMKNELIKRDQYNPKKVRAWSKNPAIMDKFMPNKAERHSILKTTLIKYKIMRFRSKISYMAFKKKRTINELFLLQIQSTYSMLIKNREI